MRIFGKKRKEEERKRRLTKQTEAILKDAILEKALEENLDKQNQIIDLENNLDFLNENIDLIREKCKKNKTKFAKEILDMIGEEK